jgi:hypothetical protein
MLSFHKGDLASGIYPGPLHFESKNPALQLWEPSSAKAVEVLNRAGHGDEIERDVHVTAPQPKRSTLPRIVPDRLLLDS